MRPELERASHALVTLASAACVSWWLWPPGADAPRESPLQPPPAPLEMSSVVPITPIAEAAPSPGAAEPPTPESPELPVQTAPPPPLPTVTATAKAAPPPSATVLEPARPRGELSEGRLPKVQGSTVRIGFTAYRDAMVALGAGFFLYDASAKRRIAEIDPLTEEIRSEALRQGLSDWPRDVTKHFAAALELGQKRYGARASRVVLMPPAELDSALVAALRRELPALGVDLDAVVRVDLVYELREGHLECQVVGVGLRDAADRALELRVQLSERIPGLSYQTSREEMQHA